MAFAMNRRIEDDPIFRHVYSIGYQWAARDHHIVRIKLGRQRINLLWMTRSALGTARDKLNGE